MKKLIVPICILLLSTAVFAQTRSRTTKRGTQSAKTQKTSPQPGAEARTSGATRVADQIKNLTRFVYLLGGVAKGIEQVEEAARSEQSGSQNQPAQRARRLGSTGSLLSRHAGTRRLLPEAGRLRLGRSHRRRSSRRRPFRSSGANATRSGESFD